MENMLKYPSISSIILCAGKSSRLKNYKKKSKVLIPLLNNKNSIDYNLDLLKNIKLRNVFVNTHRNSSEIKNYFKKYNLKNLIFSHEKKLLGTCGAVKKIKNKNLSDMLIVIYGDTICRVRLKNLIKFHITNKSNFTIVSNLSKNIKNIDIIKIKQKNILSEFIEKNPPKGISSAWVNSGIYIVNKSIINKINSSHYDFSNDFIPQLLKKKMNIYVYKSRGKFLVIDNKHLLNKTKNYLRSKVK